MAAQGDYWFVASALRNMVEILRIQRYGLGSLSWQSKLIIKNIVFQNGELVNRLGAATYPEEMFRVFCSLWFWLTPGSTYSRVISAGREMLSKVSPDELQFVATAPLALQPNSPLQQLSDAGILSLSEDNGVVRVEHIRDDAPWWEKPLPSFLLKIAAAAVLTFPLAVLCVIIASLLKSFFLDKPLDTTTFTVLFVFLFFYIDWKMISSKSVESLQLGKQEAQRWVIRAANIPVIPAAMVNAGPDGGAGQVEF